MPAGGTAWFLIGSGNVHMDVWLDAEPHLNVDLAIYAPNGGDVPVGRGTFDHANPDRLVWSGGNWNADGNWYALITNANSVILNYEISSSQREIAPKSCDSYWEYIGSAHVYWTKCK
jgi:hypothetical protein